MIAVTPLTAFARPRPVRFGATGLPHWRPGLGGVALHGEVFAPVGEGSGAALALALALDAAAPGEERSWLWVQDAKALRRGGRPYQPGLPPSLRYRLIHVAAKSPEDALFALEEGLRCRDLAFVVGEIAGNPKALGFTAARRLSLAVERHGTPLWLVRLDASRDLSSARQRWDAKAAPSLPPRWNAAAPGAPAWQAELFRARAHPSGKWTLSDDGNRLSARMPQQPAHHVDLVRGSGDRPLAADRRHRSAPRAVGRPPTASCGPRRPCAAPGAGEPGRASAGCAGDPEIAGFSLRGRRFNAVAEEVQGGNRNPRPISAIIRIHCKDGEE